MTHELDGILMSAAETDYDRRLGDFRRQVLAAGRFAAFGSQEAATLAAIHRAIIERGDAAVAEFTERFDKVVLSPEQFRVSKRAMAEAHASCNAALLAAVRKAIANVREYQQRIFVGRRSDESGATGIRYTPIRRVGVCVPGAAAPLPSTVIMTAVPAQVAGVEEIVVVSPPRHQGTIHPVILAVCHELGLEEVYRIGGAQAVFALAEGTATIAKVDKIVGPGNKWVQAAKKIVSGDTVGIDSIAGPSEVLIIANSQADPAWVAADMLSQAEHGTDSSAIVVTDSDATARAILAELKRQVAGLSRAAEAGRSLATCGRIIVVADMDAAVKLADEFATEHLEVQCGDRSRSVAARVRNAGAIFIGPYTPVAVGDYWAGPSHTLPTGMTARFAGALTSNDFVKSISLIEYDRDSLAAAADDIIRLAETEGLDAHARSVRIRHER